MNPSIQFPSPIGPITLTASQVGIRSVQFLKSENDLAFSINTLLVTAQTQILAYLAGTRKSFSLELDLADIHGFQQDVLAVVSDIGFGEILTYGQVAAILHKPSASRAVGSALARNPLPILIPCHRIVAANRYLTGYLGQKGVKTKKWLLELEGHKIVGEKLG
jgi:methylated-DNA-[protein]-cysteine S-methyltransferase